MNTMKASKKVVISRRIAVPEDDFSIVKQLLLHEPALTKTEVLIALRVMRGDSSSEIAEQFGITVRTIENHRLAIRRKFSVPTTEHLQVFLLRWNNVNDFQQKNYTTNLCKKYTKLNC